MRFVSWAGLEVLANRCFIIFDCFMYDPSWEGRHSENFDLPVLDVLEGLEELGFWGRW